MNKKQNNNWDENNELLNWLKSDDFLMELGREMERMQATIKEEDVELDTKQFGKYLKVQKILKKLAEEQDGELEAQLKPTELRGYFTLTICVQHLCDETMEYFREVINTCDVIGMFPLADGNNFVIDFVINDVYKFKEGKDPLANLEI